MSKPSELREAFKKEAVDYAISYMQLVMRPSQESKELADKKLDDFLSKSLDAVIASHPEYKFPDDGYGDDDSFNRGWNEGISEFLNLLQSAKSKGSEEVL